jgi:large subunit ribosomal protein L9
VIELGLAGEVYTVAGGFARNYLIPRGYAILATKGAMKQADEIRQAGVRRRAQERTNAEAQAQVIAGQKLLFFANAGENDRLYGSVTASEIAERLSEVCGFEIDRRRLMLHQPIRQLGIHVLALRLMPEVTAEFRVGVVREEETWADAEARAVAVAEAAAAEAAAAEAAAAQIAEEDKARAEAEASAEEGEATEESAEESAEDE